MAKTREEKEKIIKDLKEKLEKSQAVTFIDIQGMDAPNLFILREQVKKDGGLVKVVKKTLLAMAMKNKVHASFLQNIKKLQGEIALVFAFEDTILPLKSVYQFFKKNEKPVILGEIEKDIQNNTYRFINAQETIKLAQLPSRQELLAELVGDFNNIVANFVSVLEGNIKGLLYILTKAKASSKV